MIRLEDILKTFLQDVLKTSWQDVLKTSWRRIAKTNILVLTKTSSEDVRLRRTYSSWSRRLEDVFRRRRRKTSSPRRMFSGLWPVLVIITSWLTCFIVSLTRNFWNATNVFIGKLKWVIKLPSNTCWFWTCLENQVLSGETKSVCKINSMWNNCFYKMWISGKSVYSWK